MVRPGTLPPFCLSFDAGFAHYWAAWPNALSGAIVLPDCVVNAGQSAVCYRHHGTDDDARRREGQWHMPVLWPLCGLAVTLANPLGPRIPDMGPQIHHMHGAAALAALDAIPYVPLDALYAAAAVAQLYNHLTHADVASSRTGHYYRTNGAMRGRPLLPRFVALRAMPATEPVLAAIPPLGDRAGQLPTALTSSTTLAYVDVPALSRAVSPPFRR